MYVITHASAFMFHSGILSKKHLALAFCSYVLLSEIITFYLICRIRRAVSLHSITFCLKLTMLLSNNTKAYYLYSQSYEKRERKDFSLPSLIILMNYLLVKFLVGFVAAHFANSIFEDCVLLEKVIYGYFPFCVVVHWALEEETQETLCSPTASACC